MRAAASSITHASHEFNSELTTGVSEAEVRTALRKVANALGAADANLRNAIASEASLVQHRRASLAVSLRHVQAALRVLCCEPAEHAFVDGRKTSADRKPAEFTDREVTIVTLLAEGMSNKEIAATAFIGIDTVKANLKQIFQKIGVNTRTEAVVEALRLGIITEGKQELAYSSKGDRT